MNSNLYFQALLFLGILVFSFGCSKDNPGPTSVQARTFIATDWSYESPEYYKDLILPELTSSNINLASVNVYFSIDDGENWTALPYTQYNGSSPNYFMNFTIRVNYVRIMWIYNTSLSEGKDPNKYYGKTVHFKVVVTSSIVRQANPDVDFNDYDEVKERFKLSD